MVKFNSYIAVVAVLAIIFGFLSGLIGYFFVSQESDYLPFWGQVDISNVDLDKPINIIQPKNVIVKQDLLLAKIENDLLPAVVSFYPIKNSMQSQTLAYINTDSIGQGFVITNDGWVAGSGALVDNIRGQYTAIGYQSKQYALSGLIKDEASGASFGKMDGKNLPVAKIGDSNALITGQTLVLVSRLSGLIPVHVKNIGYNFKNRIDLIQSSEKLNKKIFIDYNLSSSENGSVVVNLNGEVVGLVSGGSIIPSDYFKSLFDQVLKDQKIERPIAGIKYFDLAYVDGLAKFGDRGALVVLPLDVKSPLQGKIINNDVILKVNGEEVNSQNSLSELINRYQKGDSIIILISRNGQEKEISFRLN